MDSIVFGKPTWIGHYAKINLTRDILGVSSTGYVIRIRCSDQEYALKRTYTTTEEPPDLAGLKHPHVVDLKRYWTERIDEEELRPGVNKLGSVSSRYLFLVMELMDGDLAQLMAEAKRAAVQPFSLRVAVDIMLQIARGMRHVHSVVSVPHPLLKCANVLYKIVNKSDGAFQVGDVVVKLGGFGSSRPAGTDAEKQDVLCFGRICQELLTGDVSKSSIPETTPEILRKFIFCCLEGKLLFSQIVDWLDKFGDSFQDVFLLPSETIHTKIVQTKAEDSSVKSSSSFVSDNRNQEIFTVHQLHPVGDVSTSVRATLVFFHGFHKVPEEWRRSWMARDNKVVWPQTWLPEDLGPGNIRVLSVSFDANLSGNFNRFETGKDLIRRLVLSPRLKLGEIEEKIFLVGHSFGGVMIKSLVTEVRRFIDEEIRNNINLERCRTFLKSLTTIVFYSVPHGQDFEDYIVECKHIFGVPRSSFLQSLWKDTQLISDMNQLSEEFENAVSDLNLKVLAFLEGKPMSKNRVLFTQKSCESRCWEWHKIDKDNHFEVCRPDSKSHIGYKKLKDHLQSHLNAAEVAEDSERSDEDEEIFIVNISFDNGRMIRRWLRIDGGAQTDDLVVQA
ncbi:hypothetical protein M758_5G169600 [Ceratodon purpureus]|nr:hypothetical protein M758_5G169600 [Ceratodon purpureus]